MGWHDGTIADLGTLEQRSISAHLTGRRRTSAIVTSRGPNRQRNLSLRRDWDGCVTEGAMPAGVSATPAAFEMVALGENHQAVIDIEILGVQHAPLPRVPEHAFRRGRVVRNGAPLASVRTHCGHVPPRPRADESARTRRRLSGRSRTPMRMYPPFASASYDEQSRTTMP
jgi:hypothetical protein